MNARIPSDAVTAGVDRRQFLGSGVGLTLGLVLGGKAEAATATAVNAWLTIGSDGSITLASGASDMGQGSFSGLAQILCEDLMVDLAQVRVVPAAPSLASPAPVGVAINTVGSSVTRSNFWRLRDAAALAREMLVSAAMVELGDGARAHYTVASGVVTHLPTGRSLSYAQLAARAATLPVPASAPLVPDAQLRCIGQPLPRADIPAKVDGSTVYGIDVRRPGMAYAAIRHCPSFGGVLAATPSVPSGALAVVPVKVAPGTARGLEAVGNINAVAVVGPTTWDAWQAARRLPLKWTLPANVAALNSSQFMADAQALMTAATPYAVGAPNGPGTAYTVERSGTPEAAIAGAGTKLEATYSLPYVAHACMEVLNCTVDFQPGVSCEVWAPTQSAKSALTLVIALTGMTAAQVTIHVTALGGGLGRKAELDFISQAVQVAMAVKKPVKLMWPREEDFTHDQCRPMALVRVRAGLNQAGQVLGWTYRNVSPSILGQRGVPLPATGDSQGYEGSQALPYDFGARLTEWVSHTAGIPVGFWRSVGASINTFAVESMIDELALAAGADPYQYRRARLSSNARWLAVLDAAAQAAGWGGAVPAGRARGIAIGTAFNSIVAQVVEVSATTAGPKVTRVWLAIDCGWVVNPNSVEAQLIGGVVHGLNAALFGKQTFVNGAAQARNFNNSRMIRLGEMPQVVVKLMPQPTALDRSAVMGGVGELGVPTLAPALANAWARLSGKRVRALPFYPNATMSD
ncbi:MAG: xanthine dehydrogenase family protein molybdopterin-binding subunit [Burkholderiales bacterium]|jgi:isoquinoline 1-oxidoreductase beta subunit|uniref:xanthine dehydrogenase family protein molybdopterin-binding subunit n=1 Tax=Roseateles sp. TaxID=1971397 RepID=UPI000FAA9E04|nr:MAG: xanthine dehydrogenase family protein molybdopterin-binding subunit [Burkholderiales bacterium]